MGVLIKIAGAKFADPYIIDKVDIPADDPIIPDEPVEPVYLTDYPVQDTLKGLYDLGYATERGTFYNHANPDLVPTLVELTADGGKFTEEANYVTISGNTNKCRIDTGILPKFANNPVTYVALFSVPSATGVNHWRPIIGCRRNTSDGDKGVDLLNGCAEYCTGGKAYLSKNATNTTGFIHTAHFVVLALTFSTTGYTLYRYTNNALDTLYSDTVSIEFGTTTADAIKIGGDSVSNGAADANISLAAIHEGVLDYDQLKSVCEFVYKYGKNTKGLSIE